MRRLAIIGAGHLGRQIATHIHSDTNDVVVGFYDDVEVKQNTNEGLVILGKLDSIEKDFNSGVFDDLIIAVGYKHLPFKQNIFDKYKSLGISFYTFIHSTCIIDKTATILEGSVIFPGTIIDQRVSIKENVLINLNCTISHDTIIGSHSFLAPSVTIAGFCTVGDLCMLGVSSTISDNITIVKSTTLGAGSIVVSNITEAGVFIGNPAKKLR